MPPRDTQKDYSRLDRLLHQFALGAGFIARASFEVEESIAGSKSRDVAIRQPVYIAGLARSGSTILLNALHQTGGFRSLTYRDMPFILMPGLWRKLSAGSWSNSEARERAHGDRILVAYDSPEAFEEVFWRHFHGDAYITDPAVLTHSVPKSVRSDYRRFVRHVLASADQPSQTRYLAKNNNNLLRLPGLRKTFADAALIVPFRDPAQQAASLLNQHRHFCRVHQSDTFSQRYMEWLGHYEFGLGQKHYRYGDIDPGYDCDDINYWLQSWTDAYRHALAQAASGPLFIGYEQMGDNALQSFRVLFNLLDIDQPPEQAAAFYDLAPQRNVTGIDPALLSDAREVYDELRHQHRELLG